jgi:hypothetical protein
MPGIFELHLPDEEPLGLVGPWEAAPPAPLSFDVGSEPPAPDVPVWRVNLPEDETEAELALSQAEAQLLASESSLDQVPARLEALTSAAPRGGGVSFDISSFSVEDGSPEASALDLLAQAQAIEQGRPVSYGLEGLASEAWEHARDQFEAFLGQIQREVLNLAWVETSSGTLLLARTVVGWSGDSNTLWSAETTPGQRQLHRRALTAAVKSRLLRIRIFSTVTGGAAKLALLFTTPAGAVLALPAAWKFVNEILKEIKAYQTLSQGG